MQTKHIYLGTINHSKIDEVVVHFPGGSASVVLRSDGQGTWAHIARDRRKNTGEPDAKVTAARVDCEGKHVNQGALGDLDAPDFYHVALCIVPGVQS
jgi:hypothetical protein